MIKHILVLTFMITMVASIKIDKDTTKRPQKSYKTPKEVLKELDNVINKVKEIKIRIKNDKQGSV